MSIDRIGKSGGVPTPDVADVGAKGPVDKAFGIERAASVDRAEATQPASPLERLRAGEIDVNGYADLKVEEATRGFAGLPAEDLAELKRALREQMTTDPDFVDLVRQATGGAPDPLPDE